MEAEVCEETYVKLKLTKHEAAVLRIMMQDSPMGEIAVHNSLRRNLYYTLSKFVKDGWYEY